jgi:hypothetical protein
VYDAKLIGLFPLIDSVAKSFSGRHSICAGRKTSWTFDRQETDRHEWRKLSSLRASFANCLIASHAHHSSAMVPQMVPIRQRRKLDS